jgi:hypothetical protein
MSMKGGLKMAITVELTVEQLAKAIKGLTPGELETLAILLDSKLRQELLRRRELARKELAEGKLLTVEELFKE